MPRCPAVSPYLNFTAPPRPREATERRYPAGTIIGPVRRNPATVVVLTGKLTEGLLSAVGNSMNVALLRPDPEDGEGLEAAAGALRRAAGISSPYVLVAADPLRAVAEEWEAMWQIGAGPRGTAGFELRAGEALSAWRQNRFELPDYYLVAADDATPDEQHADFRLGPLRSVRPHRVAAVAAAEPAERAAAILTALSSLRHGPWWPPLEDIIASARDFFPGSLG